MRTTPILLALALGLAFGAGASLAASVSASGHCGDDRANASAGPDGTDGLSDDGGPETVADAVVTFVSDDPGRCPNDSGHLGAGASAADNEVAACYNGGAVYDDHGEETACSDGDLVYDTPNYPTLP